MDEMIAILVISVIYYVAIRHIQEEHSAITSKQRDMINELIDKNQRLETKLRLYETETKNN